MFQFLNPSKIFESDSYLHALEDCYLFVSPGFLFNRLFRHPNNKWRLDLRLMMENDAVLAGSSVKQLLVMIEIGLPKTAHFRSHIEVELLGDSVCFLRSGSLLVVGYDQDQVCLAKFIMINPGFVVCKGV